MRRPAVIVLLALSGFSAVAAGGRAGTPRRVAVPERTVLVVAENPAGRQAAGELRTHLGLLLGVKPPIVATNAIPPKAFVWHVGFPPPDAAPPAGNSETARWTVRPEGVWFDGGADGGVLHAVEAFLEEDLGVRWPFGDAVSAVRRNGLVLDAGERRWTPVFNIRSIRHPKRHPEQDAWARRMRFGRHDATPGYGHHFTRYWDRFHDTHREFFAMRPDGLRLPYGVSNDPDDITAASGGKAARRIGMCVSSESLVRQVVADWIAEGCPPYINVCENDVSAERICQCPACRALDEPLVRTHPKAPIRCFADRYVHFTNRVLTEAKKRRADVKAWFYGYFAAEDPPRRERPLPDAVAGLVPTVFSFPQIRDYFTGWKAAGLKSFFYRPNRHWYYRLRYFPLGCERQCFDEWKCAAACGARGFDYDTPGRYGDFEWFRDYVVAKAMQHPESDFGTWEDHYMGAFGPAAEEIRAYFRYWRETVWEKRLAPRMFELSDSGRSPHVHRALWKNLTRFHSEADFDASGRFLADALARTDLPPEIRPLVERLDLAHRHARLVFLAVREKARGTDAARTLYAFRKTHGFTILPWEEYGNGDACGLGKLAEADGVSPEPQWQP